MSFRQDNFNNPNDYHGQRANAGMEVIIGVSQPWDKVIGSNEEEYRRHIIVDKSMVGAVNELRYDAENKAIMSWDGLIRPISLEGAGGLPRLGIVPDDLESELFRGNSQGMQPPVEENAEGDVLYDIKIDSLFLNPIHNSTSQSNFTELQERHDGDCGHDIDIIGRSGYIPSSDNEHISLHIDDIISGQQNDPYTDDYLFFGMRGPMIMQGWGYDLDGKPIPNAVDTEGDTSEGKFANTGLTDSFLDDFGRKSHTWPVGPIDLRWDRKRSCWVSPPSYRLLQVTIEENIGAGETGKAVLNAGGELWDSEGNAVEYGDDSDDDPYVEITDVLDTTYEPGDKAFVYFDPQMEKYYPIVSQGGTTNTFLGISSGTISAASWEDGRPMLGSGSVIVYNFSGDNLENNPSGYLDCGTSEVETWFNIAPNEIIEDKVLVSNFWQGIKLITVETCDTVDAYC